MFPSGRRSLPEQCSCRARSHPKRDGSRYLPWLWNVKLLVPLFSSSSPQTKETLPLMLCQAVAFPLSPLPLSHPFAVCSSMLTAGQGHCQPPPGLVPPSHWCDRGSTCGSSPRDRAGRLGRPGSPFFSSGCWGCFSVGITLCQDSQYSSSPM